MIDIDFDSTLIERKLTDLAFHFDKTVPEDMKREFLLWQYEDLNRRHPLITDDSDKSAYTLLYPRGRIAWWKFGKRRARAKLLGVKRFARPKSRRPILRPELFDQLSERMHELVKGSFVWR